MLFANAYYSQGVSFIDVNSDNLIDMVIDPKTKPVGNRYIFKYR